VLKKSKYEEGKRGIEGKKNYGLVFGGIKNFIFLWEK